MTPGKGAVDTMPDQLDRPPALALLPVAVQVAIVDWAAETVGQMLPAHIPGALVRVARFTPAKRARLGASALAQAIDGDPAFRAAVAERISSAGRDRVDEADDKRPQPVLAAAIAHLLRLPTEQALMTAVQNESDVVTGIETADLRPAIRHLQRELGRVRAERDDARSRAAGSGVAGDEVDKLRRRLRDQGSRLRQAEQVASECQRLADEQAGAHRREIDRLTDEVANWQERSRLAGERADRAQESVGRLREQNFAQKATDDRRLDLLLATADGAIAGLRREMDLTRGGADPAQTVAAALPGPPQPAEAATEPSRLYSWIGLPAAHLIVDGYNVSKTGYPELTLAAQRDRLVRSLAALAARTSAEVTVVFDGAAVAVPAPPARGIRVLFSPPEIIADDVIRDLARAEPSGRVVVVVSSDREVAEGVRRLGARTAGSPVLLGLLG